MVNQRVDTLWHKDPGPGSDKEEVVVLAKLTKFQNFHFAFTGSYSSNHGQPLQQSSVVVQFSLSEGAELVFMPDIEIPYAV